MSSYINNTGSATPTADPRMGQDDAASANQAATTPSTTPATAAEHNAALESLTEWNQRKIDDGKKEMAQTALLDGVNRNYGKTYGADDDESTANATKAKQAAKSATGAVVTDKQLAAMKLATANDPAMAKFSSQIAAGQVPDGKEMYAAYQANPAAQLAESTTVGAAAGAASGAATAGATLIASSAGTGTASSSALDSATGTTAASSTATTGANAATSSGTGTSSSAATGSAANTTAATGTAQATGTTNPFAGHSSGTPHLSGGSWMTYVTMAMFNATKELQSQKGDELKQIKKYNDMLGALNSYVSDTLMSAQHELQEKLKSKKKGSNDMSTTVTVQPRITSLDTKDCGWDPTTQKVVLRPEAGGKEWEPASKVTQSEMSTMLTQVESWRTSIGNEQQIHSSNFQSLDTQLTTNLNQMPTLFKQIAETSQTAARNMA